MNKYPKVSWNDIYIKDEMFFFIHKGQEYRFYFMDTGFHEGEIRGMVYGGNMNSLFVKPFYIIDYPYSYPCINLERILHQYKGPYTNITQEQAYNRAEEIFNVARLNKKVDDRIRMVKDLGYNVMMVPYSRQKNNVVRIDHNSDKKSFTVYLSGSMGYSKQYYVYYVEVFYYEKERRR